MPADTQKNELPEFPHRGPFGGVFSEMPLDAIEGLGFADALNVVFRKGQATVRPAWTALIAMPNPQEPIVGIADFYTSGAVRVQVIITPTRLLKWDGAAQNWVVITGTLTGTASNLFSTAVVNSKLLFCQGVDKVKLWDGVSASFADASVNAVPARYLMELDTHLVVADTFEAATRFPQRIRWTGAGDPTDWTSPNAGVQDILGDLGAINNVIKLYQTGFAHHQRGISQIIPTGIGIRPFDVRPLTSRARGLYAPYSSAAYGEEFEFYVGKDNVYMFNSVSSTGIGDAPMQGGRAGARKRIMAELAGADLSTVVGFVSSGVNGNDYNAYFLVIPTASTWVYNIDEGNWTRFTFTKTVKTIGSFFRAGIPRIMDLIGTIADQTWSSATLTPTNPFDGILLGFSDGTPGFIDFTSFSEQAWSITSGQGPCGDRRHQKTLKKFRLLFLDNGQITFTVTVTSETGQTQSVSFKAGTGSGLVRSVLLAGLSLPFYYLRWAVSGDTAVPASFIEFTPIYDIGGEQRFDASA